MSGLLIHSRAAFILKPFVSILNRRIACPRIPLANDAIST
jgi:hypothetical protein